MFHSAALCCTGPPRSSHGSAMSVAAVPPAHASVWLGVLIVHATAWLMMVVCPALQVQGHRQGG